MNLSPPATISDPEAVRASTRTTTGPSKRLNSGFASTVWVRPRT